VGKKAGLLVNSAHLLPTILALEREIAGQTINIKAWTGVKFG
jgi:hypothetical protein